MRKVKIEIECFVDDIHELDKQGFKYIEEQYPSQKELDELAQIKLTNFLSGLGGFQYVNVKSLTTVI